MGRFIKNNILRILEVDFVRFCMVGGTGFLINLVLLTILHGKLKVHVVVAQALASEIALFSNFLLHDHWTYKKNKVTKSKRTLVVQFHATSWPAIVGSTVMVSVGVGTFHLKEVVALVVSSAIVLFWNFLWSKYVIWKDVSIAEADNL